MGDLSLNISRYEIACKCGCGFDTIDYETIQMWQEACDHFANKLDLDKVVLYIHSGARCLQHNRTVGSTDESQHIKARAIDAHIVGVLMFDLYNYFTDKYPDSRGFGLYLTFIHCDSRQPKARW